MPLLGSAAILLSFDIAADAIAEHDDWHTHEHLPERLSIPGFLRGSRWIATEGGPRYLVLYELATVETLTSAAYLERLNKPTAWTSKMMPHYRGMTRGLCAVAGSWGLGLGNVTYVIRFSPDARAEASLRRWLLEEAAARVPFERGLGSVHLLEGATAAPATNEQRIRGADASVDAALLVCGYDLEALRELSRTVLHPQELARRGGAIAAHGLYRFDYSLTHDEVRA